MDELETEIRDIAGAHDIRLTWTTSWKQAESFPRLRECLVPHVRTGGDYLVGLHELGHVLSPDAYGLTDRTDSYSLILCEGASWAWAVSMIRPDLLPCLTPADWDTAAHCFRSHLLPQDPLSSSV